MTMLPPFVSLRKIIGVDGWKLVVHGSSGELRHATNGVDLATNCVLIPEMMSMRDVQKVAADIKVAEMPSADDLLTMNTLYELVNRPTIRMNGLDVVNFSDMSRGVQMLTTNGNKGHFSSGSVVRFVNFDEVPFIMAKLQNFMSGGSGLQGQWNPGGTQFTVTYQKKRCGEMVTSTLLIATFLVSPDTLTSISLTVYPSVESELPDKLMRQILFVVNNFEAAGYEIIRPQSAPVESRPLPAKPLTPPEPAADATLEKAPVKTTEPNPYPVTVELKLKGQAAPKTYYVANEFEASPKDKADGTMIDMHHKHGRLLAWMGEVAYCNIILPESN